MKNSLKINSNSANFDNKKSLWIDLNLQTFTSIIGACILISTAVAGSNDKAVAQSCNYFAGTAVTGQKVNLNTCSVKRGAGGIVNFIYSLGNKKISSKADCQNSTWITMHDSVVHRPQSQATQRMLDRVCSSTSAQKPDAPVASSVNETLNETERQVASYHKAMETANPDKINSHFCAAERITAKTIEDAVDPKGRNRQSLDLYLAIAKGLYRLDTSKLVYKTVYKDSVGEGRAIVTVAGPVLLHTSSEKYLVIMYEKFQPLGKAWIRLIRENGQWKICQN
jgi:hypothetical protein